MNATITLEAGDLSLHLGCRGGVILDFRLAGRPLLRAAVPGAAPADSACFPLLPLGNRIRDNRFAFAGRVYHVTPNAPPEPLHLHGAGWQADWTIAAQDQTHARLVHHHDGANLPHCYEAIQSFTLDAGALRIDLCITNTGEHTLPFGLGWHPFFAPGVSLMAPGEGVWTEGPDHLPSVRSAVPKHLDFSAPQPLPDHWINNAFDGWSGTAHLVWHDRSLTLTADPIFRFYQLFRPETGDVFAFEPMTHLPGALAPPDLATPDLAPPDHGGLVSLAPGETLAGGITLAPRLIPALPGDLP